MVQRPPGVTLLPNCPQAQRCTGALEDGFCNVCGFAATAATATIAPPLAAPVTRGMNAAPVAVGTGPRTTGTTGTTGASPSSRSSRSARSVRSARTGSGRSSRRLGGGYLALPPVPPRDPVTALIPGTVPERKRFCSNCGQKLSRERGFCPNCGQEYSFVPTLAPGEIVAGKYEIKGTMAFGGLGWIYLAYDAQLLRWVVMKGLLNTKDPALAEIAIREREFLAAVKHPAIVQVYDFITHGGEGFIVMEYVNGKNLLTLRREFGGPLPPWQAIAYILGVLPAFNYLDTQDLVYCDFKPENAMIEGDAVRLIDMGAVRRVDDRFGDVFGSKGYTAPEASDDPTPLSDLYSVARALAVLLIDFDFQGEDEYTLPSDADVPLFQQHPSLYRFLVKATRADRDLRFQTAEEMQEQLVGVLREVVVGTDQDNGPVVSNVFGGDGETPTGAITAEARVRSLPVVKIDPKDPLAAVVLNAASTPDPARRYALFEEALRQSPDSVELQTRLADTLLTGGYTAEAIELLDRYAAGATEANWRYDWYRGRIFLQMGRPRDAAASFDHIYTELPGEIAPELALAHAHEMLGDYPRAAMLYDHVSLADAALTSASFGLARCRVAGGDRAGAAEALRRVPPVSSQFDEAQAVLAHTLLDDERAKPAASDLFDAATAVESLGPKRDTLEGRQLSSRLFRTGAALIEGGTAPADGSRQLLGIPFTARAMRLAAERDLRACARYAAGRADKIRYVDEANRVRPRTLL